MKRLGKQFSTWLCGLLLLLTVGCSSTARQIAPVTDGFTCTAAIHYRELSVEGTMTCTDDGKLTLCFTRPTTLEGITLSWDGQQMAMELAGVTIQLEEQAVPESALIKSILQVLSAPHEDGAETEKGATYTGHVADADYTLVCDATNGLPVSLSVPSNELYATFTNVRIVKAAVT